jgi:hypothetical protein
MAKSKNAGTRGARKKRSGGEEMTGKKAGEVEVRKPSDTQEAMVLPKPDDYEFHKKQILGFKEKKDTANANLRNALQSAQKAGIDTDALLEANKLKRSNDHAKMQRHFTQLAFALKQEGYPIEIEVRDTLKTDVAENAYKRGYDQGKAGGTMEDPYPANSDLSKQFCRGWHHGTGSNIGKTPEEIDAILAEEGEPWPDDAQASEGQHGADPQIDGKTWSEKAERMVNGDSAEERTPEPVH